MSDISPRAEFYQLASSQLLRAIDQLLCDYGGEPESPSKLRCDRVEQVMLGAAIGFAGKGLRGSLVIALPQELAARLSPMPSAGQGFNVADWVGELSNQLLGRLKNKLVGLGVELWSGTPAVVEGQRLRLIASRGDTVQHSISCFGHQLCVFLEADVEAGFSLRPGEESGAAEGDTILFQ
ncbi:MAG: chemotaxis protein CheX [Myxococcales bacterium]|nr:chemotaxis protein CheX [Myxococcales bacterium]